MAFCGEGTLSAAPLVPRGCSHTFTWPAWDCPGCPRRGGLGVGCMLTKRRPPQSEHVTQFSSHLLRQLDYKFMEGPEEVQLVHGSVPLPSTQRGMQQVLRKCADFGEK